MSQLTACEETVERMEAWRAPVRRWLPEDGIIDEVAVQRALSGDDKVRLTPSERRVALARSEGRLTCDQVRRVLGLSGSTVARARNTDKNCPGSTERAAMAAGVSR